jgi:hypothetical protein
MNRAKRIMDKAKADQAARDESVRARVLGNRSGKSETAELHDDFRTLVAGATIAVIDPLAKVLEAPMIVDLTREAPREVSASTERKEPAAFYDLALPGSGRVLVVCENVIDAESVRRGFRLNGFPVDSCVFGQDLPEPKYGLIMVAKKPKESRHIDWVAEVLPGRLAPKGTLRKLYHEGREP